MPNFVSDKGKWVPAKEKIGLTNKSNKDITYKGKVIKPGDPFIYDGPCREALKMLNETHEAHLGSDFRHDPEFMQAVRNMGFQNVAEYLLAIGYDEEADTKKAKEKMATIKAHEIPERVNEISIMGGGKDMAGGGLDTIGGFGTERLRSPKEVKK